MKKKSILVIGSILLAVLVGFCVYRSYSNEAAAQKLLSETSQFMAAESVFDTSKTNQAVAAALPTVLEKEAQILEDVISDKKRVISGQAQEWLDRSASSHQNDKATILSLAKKIEKKSPEFEEALKKVMEITKQKDVCIKELQPVVNEQTSGLRDFDTHQKELLTCLGELKAALDVAVGCHETAESLASSALYRGVYLGSMEGLKARFHQSVIDVSTISVELETRLAQIKTMKAHYTVYNTQVDAFRDLNDELEKAIAVLIREGKALLQEQETKKAK